MSFFMKNETIFDNVPWYRDIDFWKECGKQLLFGLIYFVFGCCIGLYISYAKQKTKCEFACPEAEQAMCIDDNWSNDYVRKHCATEEKKSDETP